MLSRKQKIFQIFDQSAALTIEQPAYCRWLKYFFQQKINDDVGSIGDLTAAVILPLRKRDLLIKAVILAKQNGVIAGVEEAAYILQWLKIKARAHCRDGEIVQAGDKLFSLVGECSAILKIERSVVDLLSRMSGIATLTREYQHQLGKRKVYIAATRKTFWGYLDKKAAIIGGGLSHRLNLSEAILIKGNHLQALRRAGIPHPIGAALHAAWKYRRKARFIEIEVQKQQELLHAAEIINSLIQKYPFPFVIMLDNFPQQRLKEAVCALGAQKSRIVLEASGRINKANLLHYAKSGVDVLSIGSITHSAAALDLSLRFL